MGLATDKHQAPTHRLKLYVKICLKRPLKKKTKIGFQDNYRLIQIKRIAECSTGSILQYFRPSLSYHLSLGQKKLIIRFSSTFWKKQTREAGFLFYFLFPQKQMRDAGLLFYFLKNRRGMYLHEPLYSPTMFHGRCTTCTAPGDIWTDTRATLDIKSDNFLEKQPFTTSRWKTPL